MRAVKIWFGGMMINRSEFLFERDEDILDAQFRIMSLKTSAQVQGRETDVIVWGMALDVIEQEMSVRDI